MDMTYFKYCCLLQLSIVRVKQGRIQLLCAEDCFGLFVGGTRLLQFIDLAKIGLANGQPGSDTKPVTTGFSG